MYTIPRIAEQVASGYDLSGLPTVPAGAASPKDGGAKNKRKQTLLSLLDALQELSKDGELDIGSTWPFVANRTVRVHRLLPLIRQQSTTQLRRR